MRTFNPKIALVACLIGMAAVAGKAAPEPPPTPLIVLRADQLVAVLQSNASRKEKVDACRQLAVIGTKDAVPALAALLPDEDLSHVARYALERISDASVDVIFREALGALKGRPLVGVIASIGVRRDEQAAQALGALLDSSDADVAQAAARALGNIATPTAIAALRGSVNGSAAGNQLAVCEGLFRCAERLMSDGDRGQAAAIYDQLRKIDAPQQVRVAALRGAILARGQEGATLLQEQLRSSDDILFGAAVRASYETPGSEVTRALASETPGLRDDDRKIVVLQALASRPDEATLPALAAAAKAGPKPVRLVAIRAMGETGKASAVTVLTDFLASDEQEIRPAAIEAIAGLPGNEVDRAVLSLLHRREPALRLAALELTGRRGMTSAMPELLKAAVDPDATIRPVALSQIGELGSSADTVAVLSLLPRLSGTAELDAAEQALSTLCAKSSRPEACVAEVIERLSAAGPSQKGVLLRVLGSAGGATALRTVRLALDEPNAEVHAAALRALASWKTADAAPELLALARDAHDPTERTLYVRSYLALAANADVPTDQRLAMCREGAGIVKGSEETKMLLAALGGIDRAESIALVMEYLGDGTVKEEACSAIVGIAEKMLAKNGSSNSFLTGPLEQVAEATANQELSKRARALGERAQTKQ